MLKHLPGTLIESRIGNGEQVLTALFQAGGLVLSQVCRLTGLEAHTVQNWVKRSFVSSPQHKKYSQSQFCRIAMINMLKDSLQIRKIFKLLGHINANKSAAGSIGDDELYFCFCRVIADSKGKLSEAYTCISKTAKSYSVRIKGDEKRLYDVLEIMTIAYIGADLNRQANIKITALDYTGLEGR